MNQLYFSQFVPFLALAFLVSAMLSVGLDLTLRQISEPLRDRRLVAISLALNFVLVPLTAVVITRVVPMDPALAIGMIVYALAAGTEGGPKFTQIGRGNAGFALGLLAVMLMITIVVLPAELSWVVPGAHVDRGHLLVKLILAVAVPVGLGLAVRARSASLAERLNTWVHRASIALLCLFLVAVVYGNYQEILALGRGALLGSLLYFVLAGGAGYLLGGPRTENRRALAIMTFVRNVPIALAAASQVFANEPAVIVMVTVMGAMALVLGVLTVVVFRRLAA